MSPIGFKPDFTPKSDNNNGEMRPVGFKYGESAQASAQNKEEQKAENSSELQDLKKQYELVLKKIQEFMQPDGNDNNLNPDEYAELLQKKVILAQKLGIEIKD